MQSRSVAQSCPTLRDPMDCSPPDSSVHRILQARILGQVAISSFRRFSQSTREDPLEKKWQSTPVLLPGKSHGQRSLVGYSPWGREELDMTGRLHVHVHSSFGLLPLVVGSSCITIDQSPHPSFYPFIFSLTSPDLRCTHFFIVSVYTLNKCNWLSNFT